MFHLLPHRLAALGRLQTAGGARQAEHVVPAEPRAPPTEGIVHHRHQILACRRQGGLDRVRQRSAVRSEKPSPPNSILKDEDGSLAIGFAAATGLEGKGDHISFMALEGEAILIGTPGTFLPEMRSDLA